MATIAPWSPARPQRVLQSVVTAADAYRLAVEQALSSARVESTALWDEVAHFRKEMEDASTGYAQQTETAFAEHRTRADSALVAVRADVDRLSQTAQDQTNRIDTQLNTLTATFQQAETARAQDALATVEQARQEFADARGLLDTEAKVVISWLDEMREQAYKILQVMGIEATTSEYSACAKQERRAGHFWNGLAVSVGLAGAGGYLWAVLSLAHDVQPSWQMMTTKGAFGTVLLLVAGYAGRQASGHRRQERQGQEFGVGAGRT